ncbi:transthyretin-like family domain-containing protein [Ditylenchus destructor]|uniref:Transthyretin-like family domain-containing protein n=1 Tax=Ditylenchus destructor TaxID=166010 RepID=A0AAD4QUA1_9BILA|nr:transthyretin-like family domain-containing protein [Ditylenchus destructor]
MRSVFFLMILLVLASVMQANLIGRKQAAAAKGILRCKGRPAGGLNVKMYDHDTFTPDDKMAGVVSESDGSFNIAGHKSEVGAVRPDVKIYHKCGHLLEKCYKVRIPSEFVVNGSTPSKTYPMGTIDLENVKNNC